MFVLVVSVSVSVNVRGSVWVGKDESGKHEWIECKWKC